MAYVNSVGIARKGLLHRAAAFKDALLTAVQQRRVFQRTVAELNALTDRELADLGISRLAIRDVARQAAYGK